jgi:hypothetical protein
MLNYCLLHFAYYFIVLKQVVGDIRANLYFSNSKNESNSSGFPLFFR